MRVSGGSADCIRICAPLPLIRGSPVGSHARCAAPRSNSFLVHSRFELLRLSLGQYLASPDSFFWGLPRLTYLVQFQTSSQVRLPFSCLWSSSLRWLYSPWSLVQPNHASSMSLLTMAVSAVAAVQYDVPHSLAARMEDLGCTLTRRLPRPELHRPVE